LFITPASFPRIATKNFIECPPPVGAGGFQTAGLKKEGREEDISRILETQGNERHSSETGIRRNIGGNAGFFSVCDDELGFQNQSLSFC